MLQPSGRGAAWLARLLWEQEVASSNLAAPTSFERKPFGTNRRAFFLPAHELCFAGIELAFQNAWVDDWMKKAVALNTAAAAWPFSS